jgi:hypothetical protein
VGQIDGCRQDDKLQHDKKRDKIALFRNGIGKAGDQKLRLPQDAIDPVVDGDRVITDEET